MNLPRTRQIGPDYWVAYFRSSHIDIYRTGNGWVYFSGGLSAERYPTKMKALRAACDYILAEETAEVS